MKTNKVKSVFFFFLKCEHARENTFWRASWAGWRWRSLPGWGRGSSTGRCRRRTLESPGCSRHRCLGSLHKDKSNTDPESFKTSPSSLERGSSKGVVRDLAQTLWHQFKYNLCPIFIKSFINIQPAVPDKQWAHRRRLIDALIHKIKSKTGLIRNGIDHLPARCTYRCFKSWYHPLHLRFLTSALADNASILAVTLIDVVRSPDPHPDLDQHKYTPKQADHASIETRKKKTINLWIQVSTES